MNRLGPSQLALVVGVLLAAGCASGNRPVKQLPPAPPAVTVERVAARPSMDAVWIGGHYEWEKKKWVWVDGKWVVPPRPNAIWIGGRWVKHKDGWTWMPSHWEY